MTVIKCKMCGANIDIAPESNIYECSFCHTLQTVPTADDDKKMAMFTRANRLRFACDFEKAAALYEGIIADFPDEAESYWGLVLCKYGIEYVTDPATLRKIPTCHRSSFDSVMDDQNFETALECADINAREIYREEAKAIEKLRKGIIETSSKEEPYDIFICYKETDRNGLRTVDSVIAQDVYNLLTEKGYRVFFSRISLEDKIGQEYEPYIFAALNSAKIMLVFGTHYEHFNAVWVKNEWARFLQMIERGEKKNLIPCYKDIDIYDMPKEFTKLQAQDLGKIGAFQDLLRGIEKLLPLDNAEEQSKNTASSSTSQAEKLMTRIEMFLEDKDFTSASAYCDRILDDDPTNAKAYTLKLMAQLKASKMPELAGSERDLTEYAYFNRAVQFADPLLKSKLLQYNEFVLQKIEDKRQKNEEIKRQQEAEARRKEELRRQQEAKERQLAEQKRVAESMAALKRKKAEEQRRALTCDVVFEVRNSINIFSLANGTKYHFTVSSDLFSAKTFEVIAASKAVRQEIKLPEGTHNLKITVHGWNDPPTKTPIHVSDLQFTTKKGVKTVISANRPGITSPLKTDIKYEN